MKKITGKVMVPGGVLSPGELRKIVNTIQYYDTDYISFGCRQDIILNFKEKFSKDISNRLSGGQYVFTTDSAFSNITTSFVSRNVVQSTPWLTEGVYLEILSGFTRQPFLKINITDPYQSLVPLFSGQLNFVASPHDNYWYLFVNLNYSEKPYLWPVLVDGDEIGPLCEMIEDLVQKFSVYASPVKIETFVYNNRTWNFRVMEKPLSIPPFHFQNYEGFHPMGQKYWLGIYQRDGKFPVNFLENLCILCLQTNIGSINITPWNSLLIKNIEEKDLLLWENLLGQFGINTGHSHLELNWKLPDEDEAALKLKNHIVEKFEKKGLRTEGVLFGIVKEKDPNPDTSIVIREKKIGVLSFIPLLKTYSVSYRSNFDPNSNELIAFADGLKRRNLTDILTYLCGQYYKTLGSAIQLSPVLYQEANKKEEVPEVYQCQNCFTVYDPKEGDELQNIRPGTSFDSLPESYHCMLCEAPKQEFYKVPLGEIIQVNE